MLQHIIVHVTFIKHVIIYIKDISANIKHYSAYIILPLKYKTSFQIFSGLGPSPSSDEMVLSFTNDPNTAIDNFFPVKTIRFHPTDKPWITGHIKELI